MQSDSFLYRNTLANPKTTDIGLLVLRILAGLALAFGHGLGKVPPSEGFVNMVGNLLPAPGLFAWLSMLAEFGGGLLLVLGLFTRLGALLIVGNMTVVVLLAHAGDGFGEREKGFLFLAIALLYLFAGAGRYSLDAMMSKKKNAL